MAYSQLPTARAAQTSNSKPATPQPHPSLPARPPPSANGPLPGRPTFSSNPAIPAGVPGTTNGSSGFGTAPFAPFKPRSVAKSQTTISAEPAPPSNYPTPQSSYVGAQYSQTPYQQAYYPQQEYAQTTAPNIINPFLPTGQGGSAGFGPGNYDPEEEAQIAQWQNQYANKDDASASKLARGGRVDGSATLANANATPLGGAKSQSSETYGTGADNGKLTVVRSGGGKTWQDDTLTEWDPAHFRLFIGNLAGEVTDESLYKAFSKYPSIAKAKVTREKRTTKSKGYGFVSFSDGDDYFRAAKEMNNKYIGSHPVLIKRATTEIRPVNESKINKHGKNGKNNRGNKHNKGASHAGNSGLRAATGAGVTKPAKPKGGLKLLGREVNASSDVHQASSPRSAAAARKTSSLLLSALAAVATSLSVDMHNPGDGVPPALLPHVHLVSRHQFPILQQPGLELITEYLSQAPAITRDAAPMFWTYLTAPPDGSLILTWQPPRNQVQFGTDGYIWADSESLFTRECRGYTLECLVHRSGYKPGVERLATHARFRYRIISKSPAAPAQFDPNLWMIHYRAAEPDARVPAQMITVPAQVQNLLRSRQYLESQGQLARKEFMLHDAGNWPQIHVPGGAIPTNPYAQSGGMYPGMGRGAPYALNQTQPPNVIGQPPPSKRPRMSVPPPRPGATPGSLEPDIEDEEDTTMGDYLDHLTPQDISKMRYEQHHKWMEEIFSSPYALSRIVPVDLGLGLAGELSVLTAGLTDAPLEDVNLPDAGPQNVNPKWKEEALAAAKYKPLKKEDVDELELRVQTHAENAKREMAELRKEHAKRTSDMLRRSKMIANAERRVGDAKGSEPEGTGNEIWRLDTQPWSIGAKESVQGLVEDVQSKLGVKIQGRKNIVCVDKGGYVEPRSATPQVDSTAQGGEQPQTNNTKEANIDKPSTNGHGPTSFTSFDGQGMEDSMDANMDLHNTAAGLLDDLGEDSFHSTPQMGASLQAEDMNEGQSAQMQSTQAAEPQQPQQQQQIDGDDADNGMDLVESMDLDNQMIDIDGGDAALSHEDVDKDVLEQNDTWNLLEQQPQQDPSQSNELKAATPIQLQSPQGVADALPVLPDTENTLVEVTASKPVTENQDENQDITEDMFDDAMGGDTEEPDFTSLGDFNSAGEGLVDFDGGTGGNGEGLDLDGLDNSAFENAVFDSEDRAQGSGAGDVGLGDDSL
ncbi:MAG: hypothetical protein M1820_004088 [Bogoriella megaspora]|nr:MAG: hypothetical protein M1820_004088 [Bogoriella megaspora]